MPTWLINIEALLQWKAKYARMHLSNSFSNLTYKDSASSSFAKYSKMPSSHPLDLFKYSCTSSHNPGHSLSSLNPSCLATPRNIPIN